MARGSALLDIDGQRSIQLSAPDAVFIPHGSAHMLRDSKATVPQGVCEGAPRRDGATRRIGGNGAESSIIAGFFEHAGGRVPALLERMPEVVLLSPAGKTVDPWVGTIIQLLLAESASPGPASVIVLQRLADVLFVHALRSLTHDSQCPKGLPGLADPAVHAALAAMHANVHAPWTVADLAKKAGLSRSGFAGRFQQLVGEPPLQYLARWRIARAAELLRDTEDGVAQIASRVGYESVPSFSRAFKRWRNLSPAAFRTQSRAPRAGPRA